MNSVAGNKLVTLQAARAQAYAELVAENQAGRNTADSRLRLLDLEDQISVIVSVLGTDTQLTLGHTALTGGSNHEERVDIGG